ncbi:MAG: MltA domain-containing protein [Pseudomonadota bacterium]
MIKKLSILTLIFLFSSCSFTSLIIKGRGDLKLKQVSFEDLPGWKKDQQNRAVISLANSCRQFAKMPEDKQIGGQIGNINVADFHDVCDIAEVIKGMNNQQARNFFENWFVPFEVSNRSGNNKGLFTGYYVPELKGSKVKTEIYQYPIYAKPKNAADLDLNREEIEEGALANKDLELLYVDNPVDLFFMQVQGSGRVVLENGVIVRLSFAGKNNLPYSSIGKYIIEKNILGSQSPTYFSIKNWLKSNSVGARQVMNVNQSYVFFKISNSDDVFGSQGAPLMAERSLAVDSEIMPLGFPLWLDINASSPYQKLVIAQDTGSAIKGAVRGDVFFGRGKNAEDLAAKMNYKGRYYILLPTAAVDRMVGR